MAQDTELAGHVLGGKYRLVRRVQGNGHEQEDAGQRPVYEARHERLSGRFAVKLWPATTRWDAFRRGAELAVTLRHPGVMQVLDFNCEPGAPPFLVMEWIDGTKLSDLIAESGLLPLSRVAPLIESAAWALAAAHQQGIVHQELRPDAAFVVQASGTTREWMKLTGFGVAAALARTGTARPSRYRAPEQGAAGSDAAAEGDEADPQSDQYSLAAIAYEMLAGVPPFDEARSQPDPLPLSDIAAGVSPAVDAAIRQALSAEPEQRFAGVLEFARALRDAADGASPETTRRRRPEARGAPKGEPHVSPFFNPLSSRAGEAFRRVASGTARLRTLASNELRRWPLLPVRTSARIALASGVLLLAFAATAVVMRRPRPAAIATKATATTVTTTAKTPAPVVAPIAPETPPARAPLPTSTAIAPQVVIVNAGDPPEPEPAELHAEANPATKPARSTAWARLAASGQARAAAGRNAAPKPPAAAHPIAAPATKAAPVVGARPRPAGAPPASAATAGSGACVMSVGSKPPAEVWIDERSLGRRTPVANYRLPCGDHKLVLKRTDLDIYQMEMITLRAGKPFKKVYPLQ
jgi:Protein kinase domain